jgi:hypothetical protein
VEEMTTFTAIALDPGGTTGWAYYRATKMECPEILPEAKVVYEWYEEEWNVGQLGPDDHADELLLLLETNHTQEYHIICERFIPRPGKIGAKLDEAPRYITIAEMFAKDRGVPLHMQMPAQAKNFVPNTTVKKLNLWYPGQKHAMDAMRHLLFWLVNGPYKRQDILKKGWKF